MSEAWRFGDLGEAWPSADHEDPDRARSSILHAAVSLAAAEGLGSVSIASLASATGMSRAGLRVLFGSRQELQLAIVEEAARVFSEEVVRPALAAPPGLPQLTALCEAFFRHLERRTLPGGWFMATGVALEMGSHLGPVIDLIGELQSRFSALIRDFAAAALASNQLAAGEDPDRLAFELNGIMLATDTNFVEHDDPAVLDLARQIVRSRLGVRGS
jgi:AcrR family transcriptional regulator